jgi:ABC-2 type transport system permease protein
VPTPSDPHLHVAAPGHEEPATRTVSRRPGPIERARNVWEYRELLANLVRKELKVKYKNSVLGFVWSLLNPLLYLVVFSIVFQAIMKAGIAYFPIFLLSGLLCWNLFSNGLGGSTASIVSNASLVQKVWFPREILPLAAIGAALVHFFLQLTVLIAALIVFQKAPDWKAIPLLFLATAVLLLLAASLGIGLAAVNVYLRDTQHLLELVLLAWFWMSAVVYSYQSVAERLGAKSWVFLLNPMVPIITTFQRVIYNPDPSQKILPDVGLGWYLRNLAFTGAGAFAVMLGALWVFGRLEDNFAEEI